MQKYGPLFSTIASDVRKDPENLNNIYNLNTVFYEFNLALWIFQNEYPFYRRDEQRKYYMDVKRLNEYVQTNYYLLIDEVNKHYKPSPERTKLNSSLSCYRKDLESLRDICEGSKICTKMNAEVKEPNEILN